MPLQLFAICMYTSKLSKVTLGTSSDCYIYNCLWGETFHVNHPIPLSSALFQGQQNPMTIFKRFVRGLPWKKSVKFVSLLGKNMPNIKDSYVCTWSTHRTGAWDLLWSMRSSIEPSADSCIKQEGADESSDRSFG